MLKSVSGDKQAAAQRAAVESGDPDCELFEPAILERRGSYRCYVAMAESIESRLLAGAGAAGGSRVRMRHCSAFLWRWVTIGAGVCCAMHVLAMASPRMHAPTVSGAWTVWGHDADM